jgi:hypothetical protein
MIKIFFRIIPIIGLLIYIFGSPISADAANFQMKTGYYVGTGAAGNDITNIGFQPQLVIVKSDLGNGASAVFKTSVMAGNVTAFMNAAADNTTTQMTLTSTGFTLEGTSANFNAVNVRYSYIAFAGSDCTVTGTFCVGQYTGNNVNPRTITTGFQPSLVIVKRSTAVSAHFRTASMPVNTTNYFNSTAQNATGDFIASFVPTGFTVGATDNASAAIYNYIAFPTTAGIMAEGTYAGNGVDNRNVVAGLGFEPDMVLVKNVNSVTTDNRRAVMNITKNYGDNSNYVGDGLPNSVNFIQALQANGFQIGSGVNANEDTNTFYWFAFGGSPPPSGGSGTFTMKTGTYTGTGANQSITGVGFQPDLVIIKDNSTQLAVFRTRMMRGDITAHMSGSTADFALGITSFAADGFNLGTSTITNTTGLTYQYQAFGNAYNPYTNSGAADFAVGLYYGNGIDNRDITELPFNPGLIAMKRNAATVGMFRVSANTGDQSNYFGATAQAANFIQSFTGNNFQIGTAAQVNTAGSFYRWFAFAEGANFDVGTYTGNGVDNRDITTPAFDVALAWIKRSTAVAAVLRPDTLVGDLTQYFVATANAAGRIKAFITNGFRLGTQTETNANTGVYYYAAWKNQNAGPLSINIVDSGGTPIGSPTVSFPTVNTTINCQTNSSVLGVSNAKIRVDNATANPQWNLTIAATGGATSNWNNGAGANYDFNDPNTSGCGDGADADSFAGQLSINPSVGTSTPEAGCANTGLSFGSSSAFNQGTVDSITLLTAGATAQTNCYWDITGIAMDQKIPQEQINGSYSIDFTISAIAF